MKQHIQFTFSHNTQHSPSFTNAYNHQFK